MFKYLFKYGLVTIISQVTLLVGTYLLVEFGGIQKNVAYFIVVSLVYVIVYVVFVKYVFGVSISKQGIVRYSIAVLFFWIFNNVFFGVMVNLFSLNYLLAVIINILFFGFIRFFVYKKIVFAD